MGRVDGAGSVANDGERVPPWYKAPRGHEPDWFTPDDINALRTEYGEDGGMGWLSTLVWNTRNNYLAMPDCTFSATQMRMVVEGFMAELMALSGSSGTPHA